MVAALVLTPFLARRAWRMRDQLRAGFSRLAMLALLGMVLNQTFGYYAAQTLGATEIGLMMGLTPLMTVLLSIWLLRERPAWGALIGGVHLHPGAGHLAAGKGIRPACSPRVFISAPSTCCSRRPAYALYSVLLKRSGSGARQLVHALRPGALQPAAPHPLLPCWWMANRRMAARFGSSSMRGSRPRPSHPGSGCRGIALLGASRTAIFMNLLPVMTAALAISWLGEEAEPAIT